MNASPSYSNPRKPNFPKRELGLACFPISLPLIFLVLCHGLTVTTVCLIFRGVALAKMLSNDGVVWRSGQPDWARKLLEPGAESEGHMVTLSPYMADTTFHSNVLVILAALLCAIISVAGLLSMLRCALRCSRQATGSEEPRHATVRLAGTGLKKAAVNALPTIVYGAGSEIPEMSTDCPICLGDFVAGQNVRVLPKCNHGFHVRCIDTWLRAHSSCPSCRHSLLDLEDNAAKLTLTCDSRSSQTPGSLAGQQPSAGEGVLAEEMQKTGESNRRISNGAALQIVPAAPASPVDCTGV